MFDIEAFVAELDPTTKISSVWGLAALKGWRESFLEAESLIEKLTAFDLALWYLSNDERLNNLLLELMSQSGVSEKASTKVIESLRRFSLNDQETNELLGKMKNLADDRGLEILDLISEAQAGSNLVSLFQKNATKQGIHEPLCVALINVRTPQTVRGIRLKGDRSLNTSLSIRFDENGKVSINMPGKTDRYSKDADIAVIVSKADITTVYLCSHKFARVAGGHQDNQLKDSAKFLRFALRNAGKPIRELSDHLGLSGKKVEIVPTLLLDGEFFESRIDELRNDFAKETSKWIIDSTDGFIKTVSSRA